ncbi:MAG: methyl-accepting chemotaxis protein [Treponema sp.]|jgi:methyl-accepting chemotaxis protein|nr:methyl-accepting chemotaxis protein [Treponema sp.]
MTTSEIIKKIKIDEFEGEKLISRLRLILALIYSLSVPAVSIMREAQGFGYFPPRAYIFSNVFLLFSFFILFYLRKKGAVHGSFKYICVILDMTIITASVWVGCTYLEIAPPIQLLSIWALFYFVLIMAGAFRYSIRCASFSGIFAGICYIIVVYINRNTLDLPYYFVLENKTINVSFPVYNEAFRVIAMIVTGVITGIACKRHLALFNNVIESETAAAETASKTVEQTRSIAKTISKSTDEIFLSSKDIFATANNQAASVQEIESTINENANIAIEIAEKTSSVAAIASKMENDVIHGFNILERNVDQLENIKTKNDGVISGIIALGNKITKIRDIVKSINTITDQTKVIAFNAALEAASAGDRGKRFSVVASEVNRLADDIASLTKQIRDQVEEIQGSSSSLIISSEESADKIIEGNNLIKELEDIFREIRSGAEITANQAQTITVSSQKQQKSTAQINIAIADISKGLSNFILSTKVATSSAGELSQLIQKLDAILTDNSSDNGETVSVAERDGYGEHEKSSGE